MIIRKRHTWRDMAAAVLLCAGLASCSQDDIPGNPQGEPLPGGEYPLMLTASVDGIRSRAAGKDAWTDGDEIGVRIGEDGATGRYKLNADGTVKEAVTPVYWKNSASATVKAWYPYADKKGVYISNQSKGYAAYDFLTATAENQSYRTPATLVFKHQMAKVKYILQAGFGITEDELATASVQIRGYYRASFIQGTLTPYNATYEWYTPYATSSTEGEALLVPQNMAGKQFIRVKINNQYFYYTPKAEENVGNLVAGNAYTYTITVSVYGIEVEAVTGGTWSDGGSEAAGIPVTEYTAEQVKYGDYLYTDGTTSDGGLRVRYSNGGMKWENPKPDPTLGKTVLGNLVAKYTPDDVKPGDYLYENGTISDGGLRFRLSNGTLIRESPIPDPTPNMTVSGIVFWTPSETDLTDTNRKTPASLTDDKIMAAEHPNCTRGLAVAVKDVTYDGTNSIKWQKSSDALSSWQKSNNFTHANKEQFVSIASGTGSDANINRIYGYQNTVLLRAYNEYRTNNNKTGYIVLPVAALDDFAATNPAPLGSTGWFFPSVKELHMLIYKDVDDVYRNIGSETREIVNLSLEKVNGDMISQSGDYWSSVEYDYSNAFRITYNYSNWSLSSAKKSNNKTVRAVCAF